MTIQNHSLFCPERMQSLDATHIGEIGEYFVASVLGGFGYEVIKANGKGYDLIVMDGDKAVRVDVKTKASKDGSRIFNIKKGKTTAYRDYDPSGCDVFALVCLEDLSLIFHPCEVYAGKRSIYINTVVHSTTDPYESWLEAVGSKAA